MAEKLQDYLNAILSHYQIAKNGKDINLLDDPSPAKLKQLCVEILDRNFPAKDKEVFDRFFKPKEKTLYTVISNMNAEDLKTPSKFLKTGIKMTKVAHADILAILIGFEPRPYAKFQKLKLGEKEEVLETSNVEEIPTALTDKEISKEEIKEIKQEEATTATPQQPEKQNQIQTIAKATNTARPRKIALVSTAVLLFGGMSGFLIHKTTEKQCMVWRENHYERIDCQQPTIHALMEVEKVQPYNEELFAQEKIIPTDTTTFFKNGKSAVYYLKTDNQYEFFKQPGFHPIHSERKLNRITKRIIRNWKNSKNTAENP